MYILNFSHPLTEAHITQLEALTGMPTTSVRNIRVQFDPTRDFVSQTSELLQSLEISSAEWQNNAWIIVLPSLNYIAAILLAELHGRMGVFPSILRMRAVENAFVTQFEVAEVIRLEGVRQEARKQR